jgi:hypothetical protein
MRKAMWWLIVPVLCVAGCIRIDTRSKVHENDGYLEAVGSRADVDQAIRQLIADRGWTNEREGTVTSVTSSDRTGTDAGTREEVLPSGKRPETSLESWIQATTSDGRAVHFDIMRSGGRPVAVRVGVETGARVSRAEITADLARRLQLPVHPRRRDRGPLAICLDSVAWGPSDPRVCTAHWTARGDWPYPAQYVQFEVREGDWIRRGYSVHVDHPARWSILDGDATGESPHVRFERPAGVMVLEEHQSRAETGGTMTFEPNGVYVEALTRIAPPGPGTSELLELFFWPIDLDYARQMRQVLADELTFPRLRTLSNHHVAPDYVRGSRAAGYAFSVEQLVRLADYHISLETLRDFKQAGYDFSVDQLIHIRNYHLDAGDFTAFRDAGYNFSIDEMIRTKNYHVPVEMVRTLHEAGFRYNLDEIIKLLNYHVVPDDVIAFHRAGYSFSVDDLVKAKNYHVDAEEAARFKGMGYNFSLDDLIKLRNYRVPTEFIARLHHPDYENFTADELIDFHQKRVSVETVNKIRTAKKMQP